MDRRKVERKGSKGKGISGYQENRTRRVKLDYIEEVINRVVARNVRIMDYVRELKRVESVDLENKLNEELDWCIGSLKEAKLGNIEGGMGRNTGGLIGSSSGERRGAEGGAGVVGRGFPNPPLGGRGDRLSVVRNNVVKGNVVKGGDKSIFTPQQIEDQITNIIEDHLDSFADIRSPGGFNIFEFSEIVGRKYALPTLAYKVFDDLHLLSCVEKYKFINFMKEIQKGYINNPYHNDLHACEVLLITNIFLTNGQFIEILELDKIDIFSTLIAAIVHDFKHPGLTNNFLQATKDPKAITYNDKSILENYHISECFKLISMENTNLLSKFTENEYKIIRKRMINLVLATDMTMHNTQIQELKSLVETKEIKGWTNNTFLLDRSTPEALFQSRQVVLNCILHAADLSNPVRGEVVCRELGARVFEETFAQGEREKALGLPCSFNCDVSTTDVTSGQVGFYNFFVLPFYESLAKISPALLTLTDNIHVNITQWTQLKQTIGKNKPDRVYPHI